MMVPCDIFHAMHKENRQALRVDELTDEDIEAILNSRPPTGHGRHNDDYDD